MDRPNEDVEEKRWHLERFNNSALYWNNLANQRIFELNRQLLYISTLLLPVTASIITIDNIVLREFEKTLILLGWIFIFLSIIIGLVQVWIDSGYFAYLSNDSSRREEYWSKNEPNSKIKELVKLLGKTQSSSSMAPTYFQAILTFTGLLFIMVVAASQLLR